MTQDYSLIAADDINYTEISAYIPWIMTSLFDQSASEKITLPMIRDAFRIRQMQGKQWLLNYFRNYVSDYNAPILVIGGWLGFTSYYLSCSGYKHITEIDIDPHMHRFSSHVNRQNSNFKHYTADANLFDMHDYAVIINTSCEHILDHTWYENIPADTSVILQSTDLVCHDHCNLVTSVDELISKYQHKTLLHASALNCGSWNRYLMVAIK